MATKKKPTAKKSAKPAGKKQRKKQPGAAKQKPKPQPRTWTSRDTKALGALLDKLVPQLMDRTQIPDLTTAIRAQHGSRMIAEMLKAAKSAAENRHTWLATAVVPARMEEQEITNLTVKDVGKCYLKSDVYVKIAAKDRPAAMAEFEKIAPDLITETINSSSLAAWVRQRIEKGEEIPELVGVTPYTLAIIQAA